MIDAATDWIGTAVAVVSTALVIVVGRFAFKRAIRDRRNLPYHLQIHTILVSVVGAFLAIGLLPIQSEVRAQVLSVLGILLSAIVALSSTTFVGNALAGIMLRVMKSFRAGDFIQFDDRLRRITDIGLFHTEMQVVTRDLVTIPYSLLVKSATRVTRRAGTFVNAAVSIGYTVPHGRVEAALKEAAAAAELTEPFVFVEDLLDHAIRYRV